MDSTTLCPPAPLETKMVSAPATEHPKDARPKPNSTSEPGTCAAPLCGPRKRVRTMVLGLGLAAGLGCVLAFWYPRGDIPPESPPPVNKFTSGVKTIAPGQSIIELSGVIEPWARTELYAKASGYVKRIAREESVPGRGRHKQIGSFVGAGEVLVTIAVPERDEELKEKNSICRRRELELKSAETTVHTALLALEEVKAQIKRAEVEVKRSRTRFNRATQEKKHYQKLADRNAIARDTAALYKLKADEAQFALDGSKLELERARSRLDVRSSMLDTARADLRVKKALVRIALDDVHRAEALADYVRVHAPHDGIISECNVREGSFVQNARSGQSRPLMTVIDVSQVKVIVRVAPPEGVWVKEGTRALVRVDEGISWQGPGKVIRTGKAFDPRSRTMYVEIALDKGDQRLRPGLKARVTLMVDNRPRAQSAERA